MNKGKHTSIKMFLEAERNSAVGNSSVWVEGILAAFAADFLELQKCLKGRGLLCALFPFRINTLSQSDVLKLNENWQRTAKLLIAGKRNVCRGRTAFVLCSSWSPVTSRTAS